jgi:hypothetical protein
VASRVPDVDYLRRVELNGKVVTALGTKARSGPIHQSRWTPKVAPIVYLLMNKPAGVMATRSVHQRHDGRRPPHESRRVSYYYPLAGSTTIRKVRSFSSTTARSPSASRIRATAPAHLRSIVEASRLIAIQTAGAACRLKETHAAGAGAPEAHRDEQTRPADKYRDRPPRRPYRQVRRMAGESRPVARLRRIRIGRSATQSSAEQFRSREAEIKPTPTLPKASSKN